MASRSTTSGLILLLLAVAAPVLGQTNPTTCDAGYVVYFANGIWNDPSDAPAATLATQNLIGPTFNGQTVRYRTIFHDQQTIGNIRTALLQKLSTDPSWIWAPVSLLSQVALSVTSNMPLPQLPPQFATVGAIASLFNDLSSVTAKAITSYGIPGNAYYDSQVGSDVAEYAGALQSGARVLVVSHSQGNLYVDAAYHRLFANGTNSTFVNSFAVVSVATPDLRTVSALGGTSAYITSSTDVVIGAVKALFAATLPPTDGSGVFTLVPDPACAFTSRDCAGHKYLETYLNPTLKYRAQIQGMSVALLSTLQTAPSGTSCALDHFTLSPSDQKVFVGDRLALQATEFNGNGYPIGTLQGLLWTSSAPAVASADDGVVAGVSAGNATITATEPSSGKSASVHVSVVDLLAGIPGDAPSAQLTSDNDSVPTGGTTTLRWSSYNTASCSTSGWSTSTNTYGNATTPVLTSTASFSVTCTGTNGGAVSKSVTVSVIPAPPSASLTPSAPSVSSGDSVTLQWNSTATSCVPGSGWGTLSGTKQDKSGSQTVGPILADTTFTISCTNDTGATISVAASVVLSTPVPTVRLSAQPGMIAPGGSSQISWTSSGATSCSASGGWTASTAPSGTTSVGPLSVTTKYTMTCSDSYGNVSSPGSVTVVVSAPAPTVTLSANPTSVTSGGFTTLSWTSTDADSCSADNGWTTNTDGSGMQSIGPLTATSTYRMTCSGSGGAGSTSATVTVAPSGFVGTLQGTLPLTGFNFVCNPGPNASCCPATSSPLICSVNNVGFAVAIDQYGNVSQVAGAFDTNCALCSEYGGSTDWDLSSGSLTVCTPSTGSSCQVGTATVQLRYAQDGAGYPDDLDYCTFTIVLTPAQSGVTPTAKQGNLCYYVGKGVTATLPSDTGSPAVTFSAN